MLVESITRARAQALGRDVIGGVVLDPAGAVVAKYDTGISYA